MVERYGKKDKRDLCAISPCLGAWRMRYLVVLSTILAVYGVGLVCGSLLTVPYTVTERVRVDRSSTWIVDTVILMPSRTILATQVVLLQMKAFIKLMWNPQILLLLQS